MLAQARATPSHLRLDFAASAVESAHVALSGAGGDAGLVGAIRELLAAMCLVVAPCAVAARQWDLPAYASELRAHAEAIQQSATGVGRGPSSRRPATIKGLLDTVERIRGRGWPAVVEYLLEAVPDFLPELEARATLDGAAIGALQKATPERGGRSTFKIDSENILAIVLQKGFTVPGPLGGRRKLSSREAWDIAKKSSR